MWKGLQAINAVPVSNVRIDLDEGDAFCASAITCLTSPFSWLTGAPRNITLHVDAASLEGDSPFRDVGAVYIPDAFSEMNRGFGMALLCFLVCHLH